MLHSSAEETRRRLDRRPKPDHSLIRSRTGISLEFFPPVRTSMEQTLWKTVGRLAELNPNFVSVTYGAGGSTHRHTERTVKYIQDNLQLNVAAHLTCVRSTRAHIEKIIDDYWDHGIRHLVALRGDLPLQQRDTLSRQNDLSSAVDLVNFIKTKHDFEISVAAYPEIHPQAISPQADIDNLKRKLDAGASRAITQFFFEPEVYFRFLDRVRAAGISAPIVPGILPVTNFAKLKQFAERCGATTPAWMYQLFEGLDEAPEIRQLVAATVTAELCTKLMEQGVAEFHFYTLNRCELTLAISRILGIKSQNMDIKQRVANQ